MSSPAESTLAAPPPPAAASTWRARWPLIALVVVLLTELFLFDRFGSHRVTAMYPRWNDQIQYLSECYTGYEYARAHGFLAGAWQTLVNPSAQGTLHDFAALIVFQFVGPSRSAALALNMLALIAWQAALYFAVGRRTGSRSLAFLAALLPAMLGGPWEDVPGSAYDFRLDHLAMCAIGATSALALLTDGLRSRRGSVVFGVATGLTLLTRFLTGTYFAVIFAVLAVYALAHRDRLGRIVNLVLAGLVTTLVAGPIFWLNREWVWNYYYMGHYVGPESAIRNQNFGVGRSLHFVFGWLADRHLGLAFFWFSAAVALALVLIRLLPRRSADRGMGVPPNPQSRGCERQRAEPSATPPAEKRVELSADGTDSTDFVTAPALRRPGEGGSASEGPALSGGCERQRAASDRGMGVPPMRRTGILPVPPLTAAPAILAWGLLFLFAPALVLTLHPQKSEVVLGALAPGAILLVVGLWRLAVGPIDSCAEQPSRSPSPDVAPARPGRLALPRDAALAGVTAAAVLAALAFFGQRQLRSLLDPGTLANARQVNALADYIFDRSQAAHLERPRVAVDNVTDALDAQVLRVICYERRHVWKDFDMKLPTGITEPDAALVRQRIAESDFVFLAQDDAPPGPYPYDRKLFALRPELRAWCAAHLRKAKDFTMSGHPVFLYERPELGAN